MRNVKYPSRGLVVRSGGVLKRVLWLNVAFDRRFWAMQVASCGIFVRFDGGVTSER
jgi:hypothetical protein